MENKKTTYEDLVNHNPKIADILDPKQYELMQTKNEKTIMALAPGWKRNSRRNLRKFYGKYGLLEDRSKGFGRDKAVIGIGAGASLKRNWDYLKKVNRWNWEFPFERQPFLFMASNHQFKPCLRDGIVPHYVVLVDASTNEAIFSQLCKDIPPIAKNIILFCSIHCNPKLIREWTNQGREVQFYFPRDEDFEVLYKEIKGKELSEEKRMQQGGNVMNVMWVSSLQSLESRVFICVGNDLSYDIGPDLKTRRENYYFDGDYSTNLASGRDEAKGMSRWIGFDMYRNPFVDRADYKFVPKGTVHSLFHYKQWTEVFCAVQDVAENASFHFYNCSETGILGCIPKSYKKMDLENIDNWELMDEYFPTRWHTRMLKDAVADVLAMKELQCRTQTGMLVDANPVIVLPQRMGGVRGIDRSLIRI
jgi:hypothetical protein